jgi:hypothetical protein
MYYDCNNTRIDEKVGNAKLVKEIATKKSKIEKKYNSFVVEVKKMMDDAVKRVVKENLARTKDITSTAQKGFRKTERSSRRMRFICSRKCRNLKHIL